MGCPLTGSCRWSSLSAVSVAPSTASAWIPTALYADNSSPPSPSPLLLIILPTLLLLLLLPLLFLIVRGLNCVLRVCVSRLLSLPCLLVVRPFLPVSWFCLVVFGVISASYMLRISVFWVFLGVLGFSCVFRGKGIGGSGVLLLS